MNTTTEPIQSERTAAHPGLRYARIAGRVLGLTLIGLAIYALIAGSEGAFETFKSGYFLTYGLLLNFPYQKMPERPWKFAYGALVLSSIAFVFVMIASVMFAYMASAEIGERLGVPGFEGMLIFFGLMQVPVVLFQHRPDLLD